MFEVPILLIIFNRPDTTTRVFEEIKKIKPRQLFVSADGPRLGRNDDQMNCAAARKIIEEGVDWECEVHKLFLDDNHGCGSAPFMGIDWFFKNVEEGIILEDDCVPHQSFFKFCQELLEKYRYEPKVMLISGDNFQDNQKRGNNSYYFSRYNHTWGWASWRRSWKFYDFEMKDFPNFEKKGAINNIWSKKIVQNYWVNIFKSAYRNKNKDFWDHQWTFSIWNQGGVSCLPNVNLVSNIGFGGEATHTFFKNKKIMAEPVQEVRFPLSHPMSISVDRLADEYENEYIFKINLPRLFFIKFLKTTGLFGLFKMAYLSYREIFYV